MDPKLVALSAARVRPTAAKILPLKQAAIPHPQLPATAAYGLFRVSDGQLIVGNNLHTPVAVMSAGGKAATMLTEYFLNPEKYPPGQHSPQMRRFMSESYVDFGTQFAVDQLDKIRSMSPTEAKTMADKLQMSVGELKSLAITEGQAKTAHQFLEKNIGLNGLDKFLHFSLSKVNGDEARNLGREIDGKYGVLVNRVLALHGVDIGQGKTLIPNAQGARWDRPGGEIERPMATIEAMRQVGVHLAKIHDGKFVDIHFNPNKPEWEHRGRVNGWMDAHGQYNRSDPNAKKNAAFPNLLAKGKDLNVLGLKTGSDSVGHDYARYLVVERNGERYAWFAWDKSVVGVNRTTQIGLQSLKMGEFDHVAAPASPKPNPAAPVPEEQKPRQFKLQ